MGPLGALLLGGLHVLTGPHGVPQPPRDIRFRDSVTVESVVVEVRAVDPAGQPIRGLGAADFRLRVDGHDVDLQSATWVEGGASSPEEVARAALATGRPLAHSGRLIVYLFQKDLEPSRAGGLLLMLQRARRMADGLDENDHVAVASFDSHLKLWLDFTTDRARLRRTLEHSILFERHPLLNVQDAPSLADGFDSARGNKAASLETALLVLARALLPLEGPKSLVLFGWGMGRWHPGAGVFLEPDYEPARRALSDARVTVFALDITNADFHTLEVGLEQVAEDTGGFYAKTHIFPDLAVARVEGALAGHYVLTFAPPPLRRGEHGLDVRLVGRKGEVLARRTYDQE